MTMKEFIKMKLGFNDGDERPKCTGTRIQSFGDLNLSEKEVSERAKEFNATGE
jgi:hypothetical protein